MIDKALQRITTDLARIEAKFDKLLQEQNKPATELFEKPKPMPIVDEYEEFVKRGDWWVDVSAVAEIFGIQCCTVYASIDANKVRCARIGRRRLMMASEIFKTLNRSVRLVNKVEFFKKWSEIKPREYMTATTISRYTRLSISTWSRHMGLKCGGTTREQIDRFLLSKLVRPE